MGNEIGRVKWYGGYNSKTKKENDYGFIERYDGKDVFVHSSRLICLPSELYDGVFVIFNLIEGKKGYEAEKVTLFKSIHLQDFDINDGLLKSIVGFAKKSSNLINILQTHDEIFTLAFLNQLFMQTKSDDIIEIIKKRIAQNKSLYDILPSEVKFHPTIYIMNPTQNPTTQHNTQPIISDRTKSNSNSHFWENWSDMKWQEKIQCIYNATYNDINLFQFYPNLKDPHPLVQATLIIYSTKYKKISPEQAFEQANNLILDFIANLDWVGNEQISLVPFLPTCYQGTVLQCEGKGMVKAQDKSINAFCNYSRHERRRCPLNPDNEIDLYDKPLPNMGDIPF